jgi:hypothetical protein
MALREIPKCFLFGVGSPRSEIYFHGVLSAGGTLEVAIGEVGGIHNIYLLIAFFYGVPTALFFTIFCISGFFYFWNKLDSGGKHYFIAGSIISVYILQNLINMFQLYNDFGLLMAIFIGMSVATYKKKSIVLTKVWALKRDKIGK